MFQVGGYAMARVFIAGVPFMALGHHHGRFVRAGGLFAFARRLASAEYLVLHFEMTDAIDRVAGPSHPRWAWCMGQGMDTLLVHMAGRPASLPAGAAPDLETVDWHPEAQVVMVDGLSADGLNDLQDMAAGALRRASHVSGE